MKYTGFAVLAALMDNAEAIKQKSSGAPNVYGSNGDGWSNKDANYDLSRIGIDITESGKGPACGTSTWATFHW